MKHQRLTRVRRSQQRRRLTPVVGLFALLIAGLSLPTSPVNAAGTVIAGFEIDGNIATDGNHDWQDAITSAFDDKVDGSDDTTYTSSSKESDFSSWSLGANGSPASKVDIGYHAGTIAQDKSTGHWWLFAAWDRFGDKGRGSMIFELNQSGSGPAARTIGDVRAIVDVSTEGGMVFNQAKRWDGSGWTGAIDAAVLAFEHAGSAIDAVGSWADSPSASAGKIGAERFAELGVDLTALELTNEKNPCAVTGPGSWQLRSTTGEDSLDPTAKPNGPENLSDGTVVHSLSMPATCGSLVWEKRVGDKQGDLLGGSTFELSVPDAKNGAMVIVDDGELDMDTRPGYFRVDNLLPMTYELAETVAPAGYDGLAKPHLVQVEPGKTIDAGIFVNRLGIVVFTKATKGDESALVAGAEFTLTALTGPATADPWNLDEHPVVVQDNGSHDSDPNGGQFAVTGLPMGMYSVQESGRPIGYDLDATVGYAQVMDAEQTAVFTSEEPSETDKPYIFLNTARMSTIEIMKFDQQADSALDGGVFWLCRDDDDTEGFVPTVDCAESQRLDEVTTGEDGDGKAITAAVPFGAYWVWEDSAPKGYELANPRYQKVIVGPENDGEEVHVEFADSQKPVDTRLRKVDAETGAGLAGATFALYRLTGDAPEFIGECSTMADDAMTTEVDESGLCDPMFEGLWFGTYRIKETVTPEGYQVPDTEFEFTLGPAEGEAGSVEVSVDNTAVVKVPVPVIDKTASPASGTTITAGDTVTYTLTLTNTGNAVATGDVVDTLPAGVTVLDIDGGVVSGGGTIITWSGVSVAPGETVTLKYTVVIDATAPAGTITNTATWTVGDIVVTDSTSHTIAAGGGGGGGGGGLPFTGANSAASLMVSASVLSLGIAVLRRARRRIHG